MPEPSSAPRPPEFHELAPIDVAVSVEIYLVQLVQLVDEVLQRVPLLLSPALRRYQRAEQPMLLGVVVGQPRDQDPTVSGREKLEKRTQRVFFDEPRIPRVYVRCAERLRRFACRRRWGRMTGS
jgi:hypothetical protein